MYVKTSSIPKSTLSGPLIFVQPYLTRTRILQHNTWNHKTNVLNFQHGKQKKDKLFPPVSPSPLPPKESDYISNAPKIKQDLGIIQSPNFNNKISRLSKNTTKSTTCPQRKIHKRNNLMSN